MIKKRLTRILFFMIMTVLGVIFCSPILLLLVNSLKTDAEINRNPIGLPAPLSFSHFNTTWNIMHLPGAFLRTLFITAISVAGIVLIASMAAYALQKMKSVFRWYFYLLFVFSFIIPLPSLLFPLVIISKYLGINNTLGIIPLYWGLGCPLAVLIFHAFLNQMPTDCEESAVLEGAGFSRIFFTIVLPVLKPGILLVIILNTFRIWNDFLLPLVLLSPRTTLQLAQFGFFVQSRHTWNTALTSLVFTSLPMLVFFIVIQKYTTDIISAVRMKE